MVRNPLKLNLFYVSFLSDINLQDTNSIVDIYLAFDILEFSINKLFTEIIFQA